MKTKGLIGRKIKGIRQTRFFNDVTGSMTVAVDAVILDNGWELRTHAFHLENELAADLILSKPRKQRS